MHTQQIYSRRIDVADRGTYLAPRHLKQSCVIYLLGIFMVLTASAEPRLQQSDVFVSGKDGYFAYRIPAIEAAPDGTLLAFAEGRKHNLGDPGFDGNDIDLVLKRSKDGGRTWSAMEVVEDPGDGWSAGNPVTLVDRDTKRFWLFYLRCKPGRNTDTARPGTDDLQLLARSSDDSGATWSNPIDLTRVSRDFFDSKWRCSVAGPGGGIQTRSGRLIIPIWKFEPWGVFTLFSDDHGKNWKRGDLAPDVEGDECQLVEMLDGVLLFDVRQHSGANRSISSSVDGGQTWLKPRVGEKTTPVCCAIERWPSGGAAPDGSTLIWTGPRGPGRTNLVARFSRDQGKTFAFEKEISKGFAAYSDITILQDGDAGVLWERGEDKGYQFLTFTRFNREWEQSADKLAPSASSKVISRGRQSGSYQAFPDVCRLKDGSLLCVFYAGYTHVSFPNAGCPKGGRICCVDSKDEGRTWSEPRVLFDGPWDDRDPHVAQMKDGTILCSFFTYRKENEAIVCDTCVVSSSDGGKNWDAEPHVAAAGWPCSAPVRELPDGVRLLGVYREEGTNRAYGGVIRSLPGAREWSQPIAIDKDSSARLDAETDLFLRRDGVLYAALRGDSVNMHFSTSTNLGLTWEPVKDIGFKGHCPHFTRLSSGAVILSHRLPMTSIHISRDDGVTWKGPFQIDSTIGAYPSTIELKDGSVLIVYYEEGASSGIRAARFKLTAEGVEFLPCE